MQVKQSGGILVTAALVIQVLWKTR